MESSEIVKKVEDEHKSKGGTIERAAKRLNIRPSKYYYHKQKLAGKTKTKKKKATLVNVHVAPPPPEREEMIEVVIFKGAPDTVAKTLSKIYGTSNYR